MDKFSIILGNNSFASTVKLFPNARQRFPMLLIIECFTLWFGCFNNCFTMSIKLRRFVFFTLRFNFSGFNNSVNWSKASFFSFHLHSGLSIFSTNLSSNPNFFVNISISVWSFITISPFSSTIFLLLFFSDFILFPMNLVGSGKKAGPNCFSICSIPFSISFFIVSLTFLSIKGYTCFFIHLYNSTKNSTIFCFIKGLHLSESAVNADDNFL